MTDSIVRKMTRAEVAEHNSSSTAWLIIGNKVYDVTKFLDEHPGGCEVLLEKAGEDRTEAFEDIGHSTDAREMKEQFLVGEIVDEEKWKYSYDNRPARNDSDQMGNGAVSKSASGPTEKLVYGALLVVILAVIYWLMGTNPSY